MQPINVLVVDDHPIIRDGIRTLLEEQKKFKAQIECAISGEEALVKFKKDTYDIIILDVSMPGMDGIEVAEEIMKIDKKSKIIAFSLFNEMGIVNKMIAAGAMGYIPKNVDIEELGKAISSVMEGRKYVKEKLYSVKQDLKFKEDAEKLLVLKLNAKEKIILKLIAEENSNQQIADKLNLSVKTIEWYKAKLKRSLNIKSTLGLSQFAIRNKLIIT